MKETMEASAAVRSSPSVDAQPARPRYALLRDPRFWVVAVGCIYLIALPGAEMFRDLDRDEGAFLVIARLILHGGLPYRDAFDHKGPGIYYLLAAVLWLTGPLSYVKQIVAARTLMLMIDVVTALGIVELGRRWWRLEVGVLAACLWFVALPKYYGQQLYTEPPATAATVWAVVVALRRPGWRGMFGAGLLVALASIFKQTAVLALPGIWLLALAEIEPGERWRRWVRVLLVDGVALGVGAALPWLAVCGLFAVAGGLGPMVDQVVLANLHYPPDAPSVVKQLIIGGLEQEPILWATPVLVVGAGTWRLLRAHGARAAWPSLGMVATLVILVLNCVPFKSHAYGHYFLQLVPWAALPTAVGVMAAVDFARPARSMRDAARALWTGWRDWRNAPWGILVLPVVLAVLVTGGSERGLYDTVRTQYAALRTQAAAGVWLRQHVPASARLLIAPADPEYYYLSDRSPTDQYLYLLPVDLTNALRDRVIGEVRAHRFDYIFWNTSTFGSTFYGIFPAVTQNYHLVGSFENTGLVLYAAGPPLPQTSASGFIPPRAAAYAWRAKAQHTT